MIYRIECDAFFIKLFLIHILNTKKTPAIRSALQIHSKHIDYNHSI
jgi:hypothetical protein